MKPKENHVSKSQFKPRSFFYFRQVELTKKELYITDHGKPVLKIVPYTAPQQADEILEKLKGSIKHYHDPEKPLSSQDWGKLA